MRASHYLAVGVLCLWTTSVAQDSRSSQPNPALIEKALEPLIPEGNQIGRFQLLESKTAKADGGHKLYRIDTMTGQVWVLNQASFQVDQGKPHTVEGWMAISEKQVFKYYFQMQNYRASLESKQPKPR
jgi:hypothetical protein